MIKSVSSQGTQGIMGTATTNRYQAIILTTANSFLKDVEHLNPKIGCFLRKRFWNYGTQYRRRLCLGSDESRDTVTWRRVDKWVLCGKTVHKTKPKFDLKHHHQLRNT